MNRLLAYFALILLFSCQTNVNKAESRSDGTTHFTGNAMTIDYHIIIGKSLNRNEISSINTAIINTFRKIDAIYNKWNSHSELSELNQLKAGIVVPLSLELETLMKQTQYIVELSEGRFDPTIEPLQKLWKTTLKYGKEPTEDQIAAIAPAIGWDKIHFGNGLFSKDHDLTELDLGGIAKGHAVDLLVENLYNLGYKDIYVEWGGEIRCLGMHPNDRSWTIFISRLGNTDPSQAIATLALDNRAIATSGDYLQYWSIASPLLNDESNLTTYFHIFNPKTLRPLERSSISVASASAAASSCAFADGLATAAMMFPTLTEAEAWTDRIKKQFPEISFWLASRKK